MTVAAFCYPGMDLMIESDLSFGFPEGFRGRVSRYIPLLHRRAHDAEMAAGTLAIGGKGIFPIMAHTAIIALIERFHIEILLFLNLQGFHFKKTAVAPYAGKALINPV